MADQVALDVPAPCILLTFARSRWRSGYWPLVERHVPGIIERWDALDREKIMQDNGFVYIKSIREWPLLIVPTRRTALPNLEIDAGKLADKVAITLRKDNYRQLALCPDSLRNEGLSNDDAESFMDIIERRGIDLLLCDFVI